MTEAEKKEREDLFVSLVLLPEQRELYRKYGSLRADELPKDSGVLNLGARMMYLFNQLALAGFYDDDLPLPYEKQPLADYLFKRCIGPYGNVPYSSTHCDFAILRGGRTACFDTLPWMDAVSYLLVENDLVQDEFLDAWPMDDEKMIVRFSVGGEWYEVHSRREMPSVLDAFKSEVAAYFKTLYQGTEDKAWTAENMPALRFPIAAMVDFEIPCRGGLKVSIVIEPDDARSEKSSIYLEALPLTDSGRGILANRNERDIRALNRI